MWSLREKDILILFSVLLGWWERWVRFEDKEVVRFGFYCWGMGRDGLSKFIESYLRKVFWRRRGGRKKCCLRG